MKMIKTAAIVVTIIAATAGAITLMVINNKPEAMEKSAERTWEIRSEQLMLGAYRPQIELLAYIEPQRDQIEVAQLTSRVSKVMVKDGAEVKQGELLLQLDDFDTQLQLQQSQADLAELEARMALLKSSQQLDVQALEVEKANLELLNKQLKKQTAISNTQSTLDELKQQIQRQKFLVLQRETSVNNQPIERQQLDIQKQKIQLALAVAQRNVERTQVRAPFDGKLAQIMVREGQPVSPGTPLLRIYSESNMTAKVQLPSSLWPMRNQLDASISEDQRSTNLNFSHSESQLSNNQSGFNSWFSLQQPSQWLPGEIVSLAVNLPAVNSSYQIPAASVFQDQWIYTIDEQRRLKATAISVLGSAFNEQSNQLIIKTTEPSGAKIRVLTTRLNNPITGMKVYEAGVDPEPVEEPETENDANEAQENQEVSDEDA